MRLRARDGEDFEIMRKNMIANDIAGILPGSIYNQAQGYIDTLQEDGSWKDVDYDTLPAGTNPGMEHVDRLRTIARAYSIPNQPLFESEAAMAAIERALPAIETKMLKLTPGGQRQTPGNWWWWNLNLPFKLGFVLSVAEGKISPAGVRRIHDQPQVVPFPSSGLVYERIEGTGNQFHRRHKGKSVLCHAVEKRG